MWHLRLACFCPDVLLQYYKFIGAQTINPRKFYHENFVLKEKSLNFENFEPRNIQAIRYPSDSYPRQHGVYHHTARQLRGTTNQSSSSLLTNEGAPCASISAHYCRQLYHSQNYLTKYPQGFLINKISGKLNTLQSLTYEVKLIQF